MSHDVAPAELAPGRSPATRVPAALGPLVRVIARGMLGRRRSLAVAVLAVSPILVGGILGMAGSLGDPATLALEVFGAIALGLVIPLVALVLGTAALGTAIDDGTIAYLLVKPVARRTIAGAALLVSTVVAAAMTAPGVLVAGLLVAGPGAAGLIGAMVSGGIVAAVLYGSVFVTLSLWTGRALVIGLAYILVWEGIVTSLLEGTRILSIREYALAVVGALGGEGAGAEAGSGVDPGVAAIMSVVVVAVSYVISSRLLNRFEVRDPG
jgi:ABC-2 type transport system permease protein